MKKSLLVIVCLAICAVAGAQVKGRIIEKGTGEPLGFATVGLLKDSVVVAGVLADENGKFELKVAGDCKVLVSLVGYKDAVVPVSGAADLGEIFLEEDTQVLEEAVVQATLPRTELKGDAIVTNIAGSVLEHTGNANDVLSKVPGMISHDGKLEVIGRGVPQYYINGRRVLNESELRDLQSEEIKSIDVITIPGAAYGGDIKAVVRIRTVKRQGEGFGFALTSQARKYLRTPEFDPSWSVLDLNYRTGGLDVFGKLTYWDNHNFQVSGINSTVFLNGKESVQDMTLDFLTHSNGVNAMVGANYQFNENHSAGFRVERQDQIHGRQHEITEADVYQEGVKIDHVVAENDYWCEASNGWNGNLYYNGLVNKLQIDFNTDFNVSKQSVGNVIEEESSIDPRDIETSTSSITSMVASKLVLTHPVGASGAIEAGAEEIFVNAAQKYEVSLDILPEADAAIRENTIAAFAQYSLGLRKLQLSAGLRYEHVDYLYFDYAGDGDLERHQNNLFPSLSLSTTLGPVAVSASISSKTQRPDFWRLSNDISYHNRFTYQTGDPTLKNEQYFDAGLNLRWKWLTFSGTFENVKNGIQTWASQFGDQEVVLMKYINLPSPIRVVSVFLVGAQSIGVWNPQYTVGIRKQFFSMDILDPREESGGRTLVCNKPMYYAQLNNSFRFKKNWMLSLDYTYQSRMDYTNVHLNTPKHLLEFAVQKSFLKDNALTFRLSAYDMLNRSMEDVFVDFGMSVTRQTSDFLQPAVVLRVSYNFNTTTSKYKGAGAGESVKSRMSQ